MLGLRVLLAIAAVFLLSLAQVIHVHASPSLDLPPDLVGKLNTDLRVAFLYEGYSWETSHYRPLPIKYYQTVRIDTNGLYGIDAFSVLVMQEGSGRLTTEQINIIVKFVEDGGGLIVGSRMLSRSLTTLLYKLGIEIQATSLERRPISIVIPKDGKIMTDHPVTTGVEEIIAHYSESIYPHPIVTSVKIDNGETFIKAPFVAVAKTHGNGRVIFIGGGRIQETLSGLRLGVNAVEWVAGYTPPEWSPSELGPPDTSPVGDSRKEDAGFGELLAEYEELQAKYESLKVESERLRADNDFLKMQYASLKTEYEKLASDYRDLKSEYEAAVKTLPQGQVAYPVLSYLFLATTAIFVITTVYFARKKKTNALWTS